VNIVARGVQSGYIYGPSFAEGKKIKEEGGNKDIGITMKENSKHGHSRLSNPSST
jgi:hypothetical protein